ncbi:MAG: 5-deoxy-glucuronate isomerase, partial [Candidatus Competibacteraceae bacterium]|nr:5-deoxy-glucuronate isomerase [Candidatus Competibacteraceae bacterium]
MALHITDYRNGFQPGFTPITSFDDAEDNTGIGFGVLKLRSGERYETAAETETAWLLMDGEVVVTIDEQTQAPLSRRSLFDESPSCVHVAKGTKVSFSCETDAEFTVHQTANDKSFAPRIYQPADVPNEHRGKGQVGDTCYRFVRTIFDRSKADSSA